MPWLPLTLASVIATGLAFVWIRGVPADPQEDAGDECTDLPNVPAPLVVSSSHGKKA